MHTPPTPSPGPQPTAFIIAAALGWLALNALLLGMVTPTAEWDHAEQLILSQFPALGYNSQPPLYTWLVQALFAVSGPSLPVLLALKALLLTLMVAGVAAAARQLGMTPAQQWVAVLGLALIPQVVWEDQRNFTHTVLVVAVAAWTLVALLRLAYRPGWGEYGALGLLLGLGALSKYNFGFFALALLAAALSLPTWRPLLLSRRFAVALALAAAIFAPHAHWVLAEPTAAGEGFHKLRMTAGIGWDTLLDLAAGLAASLGLLVLLSPLVRRRSPRDAALPPGCRLLWRTAGLVLVLAVALILLSGARDIKEHWLQPMVFYAPLLLACHAEPGGWRWRVFVGAVVLVLAGVSVALPGQALWADPERPSRLNAPYRELAAQMRAAVPRPALVLADSDPLAGNLRLAFPDAVVMSDRSFFPERLPGGDWLLVGEHLAASDLPFRRWLRDTLGVHELEVHSAEAPYYHLPGRTMALQWAVLPVPPAAR
ncbi:glycosyltransferase family 39 protein [uncultured Thiohalocapsa sp.]|uniref:glycosyltransferase family 39 protein n=1 Tax=uncultured Thiohalocapsa sp. TaxID=768990 RepID=UPI00260077FC|nr:glycosyltransferase family 39 protein [uncultured Thiohalocapsa sp.]